MFLSATENDVLVESLNYGLYHAEILIPYSSGSQSGALGGDPLKTRSSLILPSFNLAITSLACKTLRGAD